MLATAIKITAGDPLKPTEPPVVETPPAPPAVAAFTKPFHHIFKTVTESLSSYAHVSPDRAKNWARRLRTWLRQRLGQRC